jgi:hypothetical protein
MVGDRYDFAAICSGNDVLEQLGLVQKIMDQLFPAFRAIFTRKASPLAKHDHRH